MPNSDGPLKNSRNKLRNDPRERGTSPPQRAVQNFEEGEMVHLKLDPSVQEGRFHPKFDGRTGRVVGEQGAAFQIEVSDGGGTKCIVAKAAHLRPQED